MHRSILGRLVPAALTTIGIAIPSTTAAIVMLHAMVSGTASQSALSSSTAANVPATATPTASPTAGVRTQPTATATPRPAAVTTRTITGPAVADQFGAVQATITVRGSKITNVSITAPQDNPRSAAINQQAVPMLVSETLQAQSANVNLISGATLTTEAYIQSLQGALQTANL